MDNPSVIPAFDFRDMVQAVDNTVITTSVKVAEYFGKRHKDVLRAIRNLQCSDEFTRRNFAPADFIDKNGDMQPMFNITRDGCMFLIMGFTGHAAAAIKESYIAAFNWMTEQLNRQMATGEELQHRYAIKDTRSRLKGTLGSRLMNERKKKKLVLALEHKHIMQVTQPDLLVMVDERPGL